MKILEGKVAVVTGGGRGIGAAAAQLLAEQGARVAVASRSEQELSAVAEEIRSHGGECVYRVCDVSNESEVSELFSFVSESFEGLDILVNNAGVIANRCFEEMDVATWDQLMAVNVRGVFLCSREAFRRMGESGGAIVNIGSLSGIRGVEKFAGFSAYTTSKHAVVGITEALAVEGKPKGIRVNCIAPGAVNTSMLRSAAPGLESKTNPKDIAQLIAFLADASKSGSVNGSVLEVFSNE